LAQSKTRSEIRDFTNRGARLRRSCGVPGQRHSRAGRAQRASGPDGEECEHRFDLTTMNQWHDLGSGDEEDQHLTPIERFNLRCSFLGMLWRLL
jgi:hypothetical protein